MQIQIIAVGKIKEPFLQEGIAEYEKRLRPYAKLKIIEIPDQKRPARASPATEAAAVQEEGTQILAAIPEGAYTIALDISGKALSSTGLADALKALSLSGQNPIIFIIGGDLGLSHEVLVRCTMRLSLSPMTFTHPMARLILVEQIYRAFRIMSREPYHK
jgi:23S rRNA (pseudouridine1915-N3)-methyltransferase